MSADPPPPPPPPMGPGGFPAPTTPPMSPVSGSAPMSSAAPERDSKLVAAGVLCVLTGVFIGILGAFLVWITRDWSPSDDDFLDFDGLFRVAGIFFLIVAALYVLPGIGCVLGRQWGRVTAILFNGLVGMVGVLGAVGDGDGSFAIVMIVWSGAIVLLAAMGRPTRRT